MQHNRQKITICGLKPLSINEVFQGRRFKTAKYKRYVDDIAVLSKYKGEPISDPCEIAITITTPTARSSDTDNFVKPLLDSLVHAGVLADDRFIWKIVAEKKKGKDYKIEVVIKKYE